MVTAAALLGAGFGANHVGCAGIPPNFYIGGGVAHIFEAGLGKVLSQKCSFVRSLEIELAVAGVDFVEEPEIAGNDSASSRSAAVTSAMRRPAAFSCRRRVENLLRDRKIERGRDGCGEQAGV